MLTYFTASSHLPRLVGSSAGMGLAVAQALDAARATDTPIQAVNLASLAARNCVPASLLPRQPVGGGQLLDILV